MRTDYFPATLDRVPPVCGVCASAYKDHYVNLRYEPNTTVRNGRVRLGVMAAFGWCGMVVFGWSAMVEVGVSF